MQNNAVPEHLLSLQVLQSEGAEGPQLLVDDTSHFRASEGNYRKFSFLKNSQIQNVSKPTRCYIQAAGRSCIYSLQHPSSSGRKMWHLLVCTRNDYVYLSIFNISGKNYKTLFFFFPSLTGSFSSRHFRTVISSQRSPSCPHFIFPTYYKVYSWFKVTFTILACLKTLLSKSSFR